MSGIDCPPFPINPNITEKINHPTRSSTIAEATTNKPILDLNILRSIRIRTITGNAVMAIAVPMNKANVHRVFTSLIPKNSEKKIGERKPEGEGYDQTKEAGGHGLPTLLPYNV